MPKYPFQTLARESTILRQKRGAEAWNCKFHFFYQSIAAAGATEKQLHFLNKGRVSLGTTLFFVVLMLKWFK